MIFWRNPCQSVRNLRGFSLSNDCKTDLTKKQMNYYYKSRLKILVAEKYGKLTHDEISKRTGVQRPTITAWMGNRLFRQTNLNVLEPIARWLECRPEALYEIVEVEDSARQI
jgi:Cro/C1-type HTH DNA-binding domain